LRVLFLLAGAGAVAGVVASWGTTGAPPSDPCDPDTDPDPEHRGCGGCGCSASWLTQPLCPLPWPKT